MFCGVELEVACVALGVVKGKVVDGCDGVDVFGC